MKSDYIFGLLILVVATLVNVFKLSLLPLIIIFFVLFLAFTVCVYKKLGLLKQLILSPEFIFALVFFVYAIPASVMFLLDGEVPRVSFFTIDMDTMTRTLYLYFNIFVIYVAIVFLGNRIKPVSFKEKISDFRLNNKVGLLVVLDIIAIGLTAYFYYLHFRNGADVLTQYFHEIREMIQSGVHNLNSYIYLFMIPYSYVSIMDLISNRFKFYPHKYLRLLILISFWGLSLFTDRRNFVMLLIMVAITVLYFVKRIKLRYVFISVGVVLLLLFGSFLRSGSNNGSPQNMFYYMNGEFILTNYVSQFYIDKNNDFKYGSTYVIDTITAPIPRSIYKDKPEMLSVQFQQEAKTNVAYAFNPVAEGLINFGCIGAAIFVPIVLFLFTFVSRLLGKFRLDYYVVVFASSVGFCRGIFSVTVFSIVCICLVIYLMRRFSKFGKVASKA